MTSVLVIYVGFCLIPALLIAVLFRGHARLRRRVGDWRRGRWHRRYSAMSPAEQEAHRQEGLEEWREAATREGNRVSF